MTRILTLKKRKSEEIPDASSILNRTITCMITSTLFGELCIDIMNIPGYRPF